MSTPRPQQTLQPDALDAVFARLRKQNLTAETASGGTLTQDRTGSSQETVADAASRSPAEEEWVREERQSLQDFTKQQFALIRQQQQLLNQQRDELISRQNALNETCLLRQQDLNRQIKLLAAKTVQVEDREKALSQQEAQLIIEAQQLMKVRDDLNAYRRKLAEEEDQLQSLRTEMDPLIKQEQALRLERSEEETAIRKQREALEQERAQLKHRFDELNRRNDELDRAEQALNRRIDEVTALEEHVLSEGFQSELKELQERVEQERRTLIEAESLAAQVQHHLTRTRKQNADLEEAAETLRAALKEEQEAWELRRLPMEERFRDVEQRELEVQRRTEELRELEAQLCNELTDKEAALEQRERAVAEAEQRLSAQR